MSEKSNPENKVANAFIIYFIVGVLTFGWGSTHDKQCETYVYTRESCYFLNGVFEGMFWPIYWPGKAIHEVFKYIKEL